MSRGFLKTKHARRFYRFSALAAAAVVIFSLLFGATGTRAAGTFNLYFPIVYHQGRAPAISFPDPANYEWAQVLSGLNSPTSLAVTSDGSNRLFITQRGGLIRIVENGALLPTPFLDLTTKVTIASGEQGLLGLAFDPNYASNGRFYVDYINTSGNTVVSRFTRSAGDPNVADPASESILFTQAQTTDIHKGGQLAFGPDGNLYISVGDGGPGGDPNNNAQNLNTLLGKILRINVSGGSGYTIPAGNPFDGPNQKKEIYVYGLRNPWRFSFDSQTGDLFIADVGQDMYEEINFHKAGTSGGQNYGWHYREGMHPYTGTPPANANLIDPVYEYDHGYGCSVTGGYVYRGQAIPELRGIYFFADFCSGRVWGMINQYGAWSARQLFQPATFLTTFGQDEQGELYLLSNGGQLLKLVKK